MAADFETTFDQLKTLFQPHAERMDVIDDPGNYTLNLKKVNPKNKLPVMVGAVQIKKNYVSYHLMAVYAFPDLLDTVSPELKKRMQGKSCFNFKSITPDQLAELNDLTQRAIAQYEAGIDDLLAAPSTTHKQT